MIWRALVLSGGGAKGEFQVGALQCLAENFPEPFDFISGVSVGALNTAILAQYADLRDGVAQLAQIWESIDKNNDVFTGNMTFGALRSLFTRGAIAADSIFNSNPLARLIANHVQWNRIVIPFAVGTVSLTDSQYYAITNVPDLLERFQHPGQQLQLSLQPGIPGSIPDRISDFILASASMPLLFPPVNIYGHRFVDGGIRNVTPLSASVKAARLAQASKRKILIISTAPELLPYRSRRLLNSGLEIIERALEIMVHEILENDIQLCMKMNRLAGRRKDLVKIDILHVRPPTKLNVGALEFDHPARRRQARKLGYQVMKSMLDAWTRSN